MAHTIDSCWLTVRDGMNVFVCQWMWANMRYRSRADRVLILSVSRVHRLYDDVYIFSIVSHSGWNATNTQNCVPTAHTRAHTADYDWRLEDCRGTLLTMIAYVVVCVCLCARTMCMRILQCVCVYVQIARRQQHRRRCIFAIAPANLSCNYPITGTSGAAHAHLQRRPRTTVLLLLANTR